MPPHCLSVAGSSQRCPTDRRCGPAHLHPPFAQPAFPGVASCSLPCSGTATSTNSQCLPSGRAAKAMPQQLQERCSSTSALDKHQHWSPPAPTARLAVRCRKHSTLWWCLVLVSLLSLHSVGCVPDQPQQQTELLSLSQTGADSNADLARSKVVPRIAIVSERAFHLEVLAGFISILERDFGSQLVVYMHPMNHENRQLDFGFTKFLEDQFGTVRALPWVGVPTFDLVISISPEYRLFYLREFLRRAKAKAVIMMVHNGDAPALQEMAAVHPNAHIMSLSPHVQRFVQARSNISIGWMLPLKALKPRKECTDASLAKCLSGFAIQGAMDSKRRNYTSIFSQLDKLIRNSTKHRDDKRLLLNVVGSGRPEKLGVPTHLSTRILPHTNLRFQDFYNLIYQNFALLPALASDTYYDRKFSSTLITSLVTGVPVVVDQRFLDSYSFLGPQHVVLQPQGGQVADAMQQMLDSSSAVLAGTRRHIAMLREQLNQQALSQIKALLVPLLPQIEQDYQQQPW